MALRLHSDIVAPQTWPSVCPALLLNRKKEKETNRDYKQTNLDITLIFPPASSPLTASMFTPFSPLDARSHLSPPLLSV